LRNFGLKVGVAGTVKFEARIKELVADFPDLVALIEPLLVVRRVLRDQIGVLHRRVVATVRNDEVCRRLRSDGQGVHFVQEDSPDEIGRAVAGWMKTLG
jgi:hypothetical protein